MQIQVVAAKLSCPMPSPHAAGVELAPTASGEGKGPASGQSSQGVYLLGVISVLGRKGKPKTESKGAHEKSKLIPKLKAARGLCSWEPGRRDREFSLEKQS